MYTEYNNAAQSIKSHFAAKRLILISVLECSLIQSSVGFASASASAKITKCRKLPRGFRCREVVVGDFFFSLDWQFRPLLLLLFSTLLPLFA